MPVYQELINFNEMFSKLSQPPIIVNDLKNDTEDRREQIRDIVLSRFSTDMVSLIPTCQCGSKKGFYTSFSEKDRFCTKCRTHVKSAIEDDIEPVVWFRKPNDAPPIISPLIWIMLKNRFSKARFNVIQWLCDTSYQPKGSQPKLIGKLVEAGIQRGYQNFYNNFDMIIEYLFSLKDFKLHKRNRVDYLYLLLKQERQNIFSEYIPFPNKTLLIIEKTNVGIYIDPIVVDAMNAIEMLISLDQDYHEQKVRIKLNRMIKAIDALCLYYEAYFKNNLSVKTGMFRRHIYGSRANFSFRAVVTSITEPHQYDEVWVPWGIALTAFRPHLVSKMSSLGMDNNSIIGMLYGHINTYNPMLHAFMNELITESPDGAGPVIALQRNPSLERGSMQRVFITRFKEDVTDLTISLGILIVKGFNADKVYVMFKVEYLN